MSPEEKPQKHSAQVTDKEMSEIILLFYHTPGYVSQQFADRLLSYAAEMKQREKKSSEPS